MNKKSGILEHLSFFKKDNSKKDHHPYLIVGLGNPGRNYKSNRHNIGFMILDLLAERFGEVFKQYEQKSLLIKTTYEGKNIFLAKPQTFMNLSGQTVRSLLRYYKIQPNQLLIAFDDVDLPLGAMRIRPHGSSGGHRGVESIITQLGTNDFPRLRVGIGRPSGRKNTSDYVLENFTQSEMDILQFTLNQAVDAILYFIIEGIEASMNKYNMSSI